MNKSKALELLYAVPETGATPEIIDSLVEFVKSQPDDADSLLYTNNLLADLLAKIRLTLKGPDPEMGLHFWHDLPELVERQRQRIAELESHAKQSAAIIEDVAQEKLYDSEYDGRVYEHCAYCSRDQGKGQTHDADCLMIRAKEFLRHLSQCSGESHDHPQRNA